MDACQNHWCFSYPACLQKAWLFNPPQKNKAPWESVIVRVFIFRAKLRTGEDPTLGLSKKPSQSVLRCHNCLQQETVNSEIFRIYNEKWLLNSQNKMQSLISRREKKTCTWVDFSLRLLGIFWKIQNNQENRCNIHLWHFRWLACHLPPICKPKDVLWNDQRTCMTKDQT